jgi:hypothetical protein
MGEPQIPAKEEKTVTKVHMLYNYAYMPRKGHSIETEKKASGCLMLGIGPGMAANTHPASF